MRNSKKLTHSLLLILTALIWGVAFVAQSTGGDAVGPYAFNSIRSLIGGLALLPVIALLDRIAPSGKKPHTPAQKKQLFLGGLCCGIMLFLGSTFQQVGLYLGSPAGKAGFLTACYIVLVPILGLFLKKKCGWNIWIGVVIAVAGLYLLCIKAGFFLQTSDLLLLICSVCFALHILVIDHFSPLVDGVRMSCIQFLVCGIIGLIPAFFSDMHHSPAGILSWSAVLASPQAWISLLYAGILSCGVGYTLQIIGQEGLHPAVASLLMSLESVFSVLAGWIILHQTLSARELGGCALLFAAILLAQVPVGRKRDRRK